MQSPLFTNHTLTDLAEQAERFMLMAYERQPAAKVLHNDSWALTLAGHARELALRRLGASPDLPPLARVLALLEACRYWTPEGGPRTLEDVAQEFQRWTGPDYLQLNLALSAALPTGNGPLRAELADVLHDARLAQRLLAGTEGAELAWLEQRYATGEANDPTHDRTLSLRRYLDELRNARFRSVEMRQQYQHTHSAVLLDLQRLVDRLLRKDAAVARPVVDAANPHAPSVAGLGQVENGPSRQGVQTYFRTVFRNHINLGAMADQKAAIMISLNVLMIGALVTFVSYRNWAETRPEILLPIALFTVCGLVSLVYAVLAVRPRNQAPAEENLAFFGSFSRLTRADFARKLEQRLTDPNAIYGLLIDDLHGLGESLRRKNRLLRVAYTIFLAGLTVSVIALGVVLIG